MATEIFKPTRRQNLFSEYGKRFGHEVPLKEDGERIEAILEHALKTNQPVPEFKNPKPRIDD